MLSMASTGSTTTVDHRESGEEAMAGNLGPHVPGAAPRARWPDGTLQTQMTLTVPHDDNAIYE